jgi:ferredoxin
LIILIILGEEYKLHGENKCSHCGSFHVQTNSLGEKFSWAALILIKFFKLNGFPHKVTYMKCSINCKDTAFWKLENSLNFHSFRFTNQSKIDDSFSYSLKTIKGGFHLVSNN